MKLKLQSKLELRCGNHVAYRQTDRQTDGQRDSSIPPTNFVGRGFKNVILSQIRKIPKNGALLLMDDDDDVALWSLLNKRQASPPGSYNAYPMQMPGMCGMGPRWAWWRLFPQRHLLTLQQWQAGQPRNTKMTRIPIVKNSSVMTMTVQGIREMLILTRRTSNST